MTSAKARNWRTWHLLALYVLGAAIEWLGRHLAEWASDRLKRAWFPEPPATPAPPTEPPP